MRRNVVPFCVLGVLAALLFVVGGCGKPGLSGPTGTVTGKVTYKGEPVPAGCTVMFMHQDTSTPASGQTSADGSYSLTMRGESKTLVGEYKISVAPPTSDDPAEIDKQEYEVAMTGGTAQATTGPPFPDKYLLAKTSGLTFKVEEGSNTFDIEMAD